MEYPSLHGQPISVSLLLFLLLLFLLHQNVNAVFVSAKTNVYIAYMGERSHEDPAMIEEAHHNVLATVLGSKAAAEESIIYSYKHGFSGFSVKLTRSQARILEEQPEVVHLVQSHLYKLHTTRTWDFLGLPLHAPQSDNLLTRSGKGNGSIIGMIDSGIWPESQSFNDKEMGPVPTHWKGQCQSGQHFKSTSCNKKLIGARWYIKGFVAQLGKPYNTSAYNEYLSPRDGHGHGTHTSSTAGGSLVHGVSYQGLAQGIARGGAPHARLAIYKACWTYGGGLCSDADVLKAMDDAIHDGVDVISLSIGDPVPVFPDIHPHNGISVGAFHAVAKGIPVVCSAGNGGPTGQTVTNTAPWIITVAASTLDREFPTAITLGDKQTLLGQGLNAGNATGFAGLYFNEGDGLDIYDGGSCDELPYDDPSLAGKIALCFGSPSFASIIVNLGGGVGVIAAADISTSVVDCVDIPCVTVDYQIGTQILNYVRSTRSPKVKISLSKTLVGKPVSIKIALFSSRGPSSMAPEVLKPDVAAPGVNVLAALSPANTSMDPTYGFKSGTSMACPHVAGVVALLRVVHPSWSPAAIKSALVTTASTTDSSGEPIYALGTAEKVADPFDFGGGIVNPNKAANPGLIYDMGVPDYIHYLCSMGYNNSVISKVSKKSVLCPKEKPSLLDLNLPAFTIPRLKGTVTVSRTVTNAGPVNSVYHVSIEAPTGVKVVVVPSTLMFKSSVKKLSFKVTFHSSHKVQRGYYFGSLSWSDGEHVVRSPISVKTEIPPSFADLS